MPDTPRPHVVLLIGFADEEDAVYVNGRKLTLRDPMNARACDVVAPLAEALGATVEEHVRNDGTVPDRWPPRGRRQREGCQPLEETP